MNRRYPYFARRRPNRRAGAGGRCSASRPASRFRRRRRSCCCRGTDMPFRYLSRNPLSRRAEAEGHCTACPLLHRHCRSRRCKAWGTQRRSPAKRRWRRRAEAVARCIVVHLGCRRPDRRRSFGCKRTCKRRPYLPTHRHYRRSAVEGRYSSSRRPNTRRKRHPCKRSGTARLDLAIRHSHRRLEAAAPCIVRSRARSSPRTRRSRRYS